MSFNDATEAFTSLPVTQYPVDDPYSLLHHIFVVGYHTASIRFFLIVPKLSKPPFAKYSINKFQTIFYNFYVVEYFYQTHTLLDAKPKSVSDESIRFFFCLNPVRFQRKIQMHNSKLTFHTYIYVVYSD